MCRTTTYVAAYPRRCGEHDEFVKSMDIDPGLPPQVRGAPIGPFHTFFMHAAYPRRCGEHFWSATSLRDSPGLPPQVRGARQRSSDRLRACGLTPAGAGSTAYVTGSARVTGAYPRRCGEHVQGLVCPADTMGLPPQVRGARATPHARVDTGWLTPAGAGSTSSIAWAARWDAAYPRRCGEHRTPGARITGSSGLPPQVRGAPRPHRDPEPTRGLTPAGAGSTDDAGSCGCTDGAYPRRCGEHRRDRVV